MGSRTAKEDVLVGGLDDWADAGWVWQSTECSGLLDRAERRSLTFGLIAELVMEELMIPGDLVNKTHVPWQCTKGEAIERIIREWLCEWRDEIPNPGAIVWLSNTSTGDEIARGVLRREASAYENAGE